MNFSYWHLEMRQTNLHVSSIHKMSLVYWADMSGTQYLIMRENWSNNRCLYLFVSKKSFQKKKITIDLFPNSSRFIILSYLFICKWEASLNLAIWKYVITTIYSVLWLYLSKFLLNIFLIIIIFLDAFYLIISIISTCRS